MIPQRKKRNSSKVNLTISLVFHGALILAVFFLAAREGMLGKKLKELTVTMVPKEKKSEPPKEKSSEPRTEPPPALQAKAAAPPPARVETAAAAPPPATVSVAPEAAPAAVDLPAFEFHDGAREVQSLSDSNSIYKALVEHRLRSRWNRPEDMADDAFAADVELSVDRTGKITNSRWVSGSSNARWDDTVKAALAATVTINRPPPKGFPEKFLVRFDVESQKSEPVMQLSLR